MNRARTTALLVLLLLTPSQTLQPTNLINRNLHATLTKRRPFISAHRVRSIERTITAYTPVVAQWSVFGGLVAGATGFLWGAAGVGAAKVYAGSVLSGTAWTLAADHVLPGGGRRVAEALGGTSVGVPCRVRDAVEKAATAAGLEATPTAFLVPTAEPNAFAAGRGADTVVAVTSGLVDALDRRELEAVVAHEVSHIKHNDVGRAVQHAAMVSGLTAAYRAGRRALRDRDDDSKKSAGAAVAAVGALSAVAGALLRLASSRHDEYAADAAAARMSDPEALARALGKIEGLARAGTPRDVLGARAGAYEHAYFANPDAFAGLLATHPPTRARVAKLRGGGPTPQKRAPPAWARFAAEAVATSPL